MQRFFFGKISFLIILLLVTAAPLLVSALTSDEYLQLVTAQRSERGLTPLNATQINATTLSFNSLTPAEKTYFEGQIDVYRANNGLLPIGAGIATKAAGVGTYSAEDQATLANAQAEAVKNPATSAKTTCAGFFNSISSPFTCFTRAIFAGTASFLIYIGVACLTASGLLFEAILEYTVISFKVPMYASIEPGINNAWAVFRDISNILIIGFFTFIAISTILGISEYGAKKLLSRVLIVAVLINFSLLFTKLVIDGSNFTAYQFYNASISDIDKKKAATTGSKTETRGDGIAGSFIGYLGVTGFSDSYDAIRKVQDANDDASAGLVIGVLSFIFLIATALVFLYGSFILATRAILFIVLLITSSLAFATYLIPSLSDNYGWSKWWGALVKNAILAPILMMMLWATLTVSAGISSSLAKVNPDGSISRGTLGALANDPTNAGNITALLNFVIILGLLFASFKLASKFSSGIGGFNPMSLVPMLGKMGLGATAGMGAALGRNTFGRSGAYRSLAAEQEINKHKEYMRDLAPGSAAHSQALQKMEALRKQKADADKMANRNFNLLGTTIGKAIAKRAGMTVNEKESFAAPRKKAAEEAAKNAAELVVSKNDATKAAQKVVKEETDKQLAALSSEKDPHNKVLVEAEKNIQTEKDSSGLVSQRDAAVQERKDAERMKAQHDRDALSGAMDDAAHKSALQAEDNRIKAAAETTRRIDNVFKNIEDTHRNSTPALAATAQVAHIDKKIADLNKARQDQITNLSSRFQEWSADSASKIAASEAHADDYTAQLIRKELEKKVKDNRVKDIIKAQAELMKDQDDAAAPTTPASPSTSTTT